jgi:hypothetical protein
MRTILIAQRDAAFAAKLAVELRQAGYNVIVRPGPVPKRVRCIRCKEGYCPLTEAADLVIYDPHLRVTGRDDQSHLLVVDCAEAHPDVPILLAWSPASVPDVGTLRAIRAQVPWVRLAAQDSDAFLRQIENLLAAASAQRGNSHESARNR